MTLRKLVTSENRADYFRRIIKEYEQAEHYFKLAHNTIFRAEVKNNVGNVLRQMRRFKEAHQYLIEARRLASLIKDKAVVAQIDDTRAQLLIDQGRLNEAEAVARSAARRLRKSGHQVLLADTLINHGIALARLGRKDQARFTFQEAIEAAHEIGAFNKAGLAALTLIEEIEDLTLGVLAAAYLQASEWLTNCQSQQLLLRFKAAGAKLAAQIQNGPSTKDAKNSLFNEPLDLAEEVLKFERKLISEALAKVNGRVSYAAKLLGIGYQGLAYIIEARHPELLKQRTPIYRRPKRQ
jgi:Tfp pilus assembly protein PilF